MSEIFKWNDHEIPVADYDLSNHPLGGKHLRLFFANGWGVSVISHMYSYGGAEGLYEVAVTNGEGGIVYDNPVAPEGVRGYLTPQDVVDMVREVLELTRTPDEERDYQEFKQIYNEGFGRKAL